MNNGNNENPQSLKQVEKEHVLKILQSTPNLTAAAKVLGIDRGTLYDIIERVGFIKIWVAADTVSATPPPQT